MSIKKLRGRTAFAAQDHATKASTATATATATTTTTKTTSNTNNNINNDKTNDTATSNGQSHSHAASISINRSSVNGALSANGGHDGVKQHHSITTNSSSNCSTATPTVATTAVVTVAARKPCNGGQPSSGGAATSLLKIEPFVPSFNARLQRRPAVSRSNSTLSGGGVYLKHAGGVGAGAVVMGGIIDNGGGGGPAGAKAAARSMAVHMRRPAAKAALARQRSKSTSSSASNRPGTGATATTPLLQTAPVAAASPGAVTVTAAVTPAFVTPQPNGICRIARPPREQEQLPDRINYDRRGLTAIPIFEHEPNLRLLSLQHNLINIFHIPKEAASIATATAAAAAAATAADQHQQRDAGEGLQAVPLGRLQRSLRYMPPMTGTTASPPPPSSSPLLTTQPMMAIGGCNGLQRNNRLLQQRQLNYFAVAAQQQQQQQQQQQHRFGMRRSKSFVSNYARHAATLKRSQQQLRSCQPASPSPALLARIADRVPAPPGTLEARLKSSFDLVGGELGLGAEDDDAGQQQLLLLEVKNRQLASSYGAIFEHLVFLDLYDNQIERIANLDGLPALSVLLLGKNRITDISGLGSLSASLRVLDLHGNKITSISNNRINCLPELKSLNLAGNQIRQINQNDFNGLRQLKELNLKRNKLKRINGFQHLEALERLWLCHNELHRVEDMASIAKVASLLEVTIENNPVSLAGDCVSFLVSHLPHLQSLSQMPITEEVRRAALAWRRNKERCEARDQTHMSADAFQSIRREEVISNARTNWELLRSQQNAQAGVWGRRGGGGGGGGAGAGSGGVGGGGKQSPGEPLAKINESNEVLAVSYEEQLQDFIKLPPIKATTATVTSTGNTPAPSTPPPPPATAALNEPDLRLSGSSGSSLGPNVDSSSSCFSSDNEESLKSEAEQERARVRKCQRTVSMRGRAYEISGGDKTPKATARTAATWGRELALSKREARGCNGGRKENATAAGKRQAASPKSYAENTEDGVEQELAASSQPQQHSTSSSSLLGVADIGKRRTAATTRAATPTTPITGSSRTLSLGFHTHIAAVGGGGGGGAAPVTPQHSNRYMQGSMVRSQTMLGSGSAKAVATKAPSSHNGPIGATSAVPTASQAAAKTPATAPPTSLANSSTTDAATTTTTATAATTTTTVTTATTTSAPVAAGGSAVAVGTAQTPVPNAKSATHAAAAAPTSVAEREREQGGDYLIEICGRYLNVYGQGALRFIDKQWSPSKANDVHTLNFSYMNFNSISAVLGRIKVRFPHAEHFVFRETNIGYLGQLNALAELQGITSLHIDPEGNAITTKDLWRQYAVYRLSHWGLRLLNGIEVSDAETDAANDVYAGLSDLVLWSMPEAMLQPLLARLRLDETCSASKMSPKEWLMRADNKSLRLVVGKEALQWKKQPSAQPAPPPPPPPLPPALLPQQQQQHQGDAGALTSAATAAVSVATMAAQGALGARERGKQHFALMMENTCNAVEKLHQLETLWPSLLLDIVRNTLLDYSQLDVYVRNLMSEIMK